MGKGMKGLFVTGTDTGVGKTWVTAALIAHLNRPGWAVGAMKPIETGMDDRRGSPAVEGKTDGEILRSVTSAYANRPYTLAEARPFSFKLPAAPLIAAQFEGKRIDLHLLKCSILETARKFDFLLVEGAGGVMVPLTETKTVADLIKTLGLAAVIVARGSLGTINHTALTVEALKSRGIPILGVILNDSSKPDPLDPTHLTNAEQIERMTRVPVLGRFTWQEERPDIASLKRISDESLRGPRIHDLLRGLEGQGSGRAGLDEISRRHLWYPFTQMKEAILEPPLIIESAHAHTLVDTQGAQYIDANSSLWVNVHGHSHPRIVGAIQTQAALLDHSTLLGLSNVPAIELAQKLIELAPPGLSRVFYSDNGSTAVEVALKMAFQYWQQSAKPEKTRFLTLKDGYHGDTLGSVSLGGIDLFHKIYKPLLFETHQVPAPHCYRCPWDLRPKTCSLHCADVFLEEISRRSHELAAVVIEPLVQGAAGIQTLPQGYLKAVRKACDDHDVLLIVDEVATGWGRTGTLFACEQEGVTPDLMTTAKGISGGALPLAATLAKEKIFEAFLGNPSELKTFFHGHSYSGNPIACAAALASIEVFKDEQTLQKLPPKIEALREGLERFAALRHVGDVRQVGLMVGIELVQDRQTRTPFQVTEQIGAAVCKRARHFGVMTRPLGDVIVLMPPLSIAKSEIEQMLSAVFRSIREVTEV